MSGLKMSGLKMPGLKQFGEGRLGRSALISLASLVIQAVAAVYFIVDGVDDALTQLSVGINGELIMECLVALALLLALIVSARQLRQSLADMKRLDEALQTARGSMSSLLHSRFAEWGLSGSEAEVALFALKGCSISEIARLRNTAEGTVRSQLSQVYAKANVSNQAMLIAHFIEELV
jgi:DNA-binding CsgD family transcriptional regulator